MILPMLNEAVACLHDRVVDDADLLDAGVIFGTGFAPFRGGPIQYIRDTGVDAIKSKLDALASRHGDRFKAAARLGFSGAAHTGERNADRQGGVMVPLGEKVFWAVIALSSVGAAAYGYHRFKQIRPDLYGVPQAANRARSRTQGADR